MRGFRARWDNERFYMIVSVFYGLGVSFLSEGYVQAYLLELGMGVREIGLYGTLGYVAALAAYALFAVYKPRSGGYLGAMFVAALMLAAFPLILTAAGGLAAPGVLVLTGGALYQFMLGFRGSCDYSAVPVIMPRASYGRLSGRCGMIGSGLAAAVSAMGAVVIAGQNAMTGYRAMFIAAAAALLISAAAIRGYRPSHHVDAQTRSARSVRRMSAKNAWILLPHLLRGIASGGFYYFVAISLDRVTLGASGSSLIVTVGVVGSMMGCLAFMQLEKRMKTGAVTLIGNVGAGLCALFRIHDVQ